MTSSQNSRNARKIPLVYALLWILLSIFLFSGSAFLIFYYYKGILDKRNHDAKYNIIAIVQSTTGNEQLQCVYLAELMGLSMDKPQNLYAFDAKEAEKSLLRCPVIKDAKVKKIKPGTILVEYTLRKPIAFLGDLSNTAIDEDGTIFPFKPFFTPKNLPLLFIGPSEHFPGWGESLSGPRAELALKLQKLAAKNCCIDHHRLVQLDVSKAYNLSCGERQIVAIFENFDHSEFASAGSAAVQTILRLSTENYRRELANYMAIKDHLTGMQRKTEPKELKEKKFIIIDFRVPDLAFVKSG